jgi:hypothetical protein
LAQVSPLERTPESSPFLESSFTGRSVRGPTPSRVSPLGPTSGDGKHLTPERIRPRILVGWRHSTHKTRRLRRHEQFCRTGTARVVVHRNTSNHVGVACGCPRPTHRPRRSYLGTGNRVVSGERVWGGELVVLLRKLPLTADPPGPGGSRRLASLHTEPRRVH